MDLLSVLVQFALFAAPSPTDVRQDLDAHPWRPVPAAPAAPVVAPPATAETTSRAAPAPATAAMAPTGPSQGKSASASGPWQLQLGALASPEAAISEKTRLEKILGAGKVDLLLEGNIRKLRYGRYATRVEAETAQTALKSKGVESFATQQP
jgi:cell division septation protein DedD